MIAANQLDHVGNASIIAKKRAQKLRGYCERRSRRIESKPTSVTNQSFKECIDHLRRIEFGSTFAVELDKDLTIRCVARSTAPCLM